MNTRQMKKCLKKQINRLESDNDLMRRIIADSPTMQELYDLFNKPLNVRNTTMSFQQFKAKRMIPGYMVGDERFIEHTKQEVAKDLFDLIKNNITYAVDAGPIRPAITASIFVGREG